MTIAQQTLDLNDADNMTLTIQNLDNVAVQKHQDNEEEVTIWIFADESALSCGPDNDWSVVPYYGFHRDYEQLC